MRRAAKVDANHGAIVEALLSVSGVTVHSLAGVGCGCPDLLVGAKGKSYLVEIKDGEKYPSRRMLTPEQRRWIETLDRLRSSDSEGHRPGDKLGPTNHSGR